MNANALPEGWEWENLDGVTLEYISGGTPSTRVTTYWQGGVPWTRSANLTANYLKSGEKFISREAVSETATNVVPKNNVLVATRVGVGKATVNLIDVAISQDLTGLVLDVNRILPIYLVYYLHSPNIQRLFEQYSRGTTIQGIQRSDLSRIKIPLPPLDTQRKIVAILDKTEATQRLRAEADALMQDFLQSVFLEMFGDPISNPLGWEKQKLGDLCVIRRGASPRPIKNYLGGTVPWIKIGDGTKGDDLYISATDEKIIEDGVSKSVFLKKGSLIFANCGVSLGFARIINIDGCIHDGWLALEEIKPNLNKIFLLKLINSISDYFRKTAPEGTQPNLNTGIIKSFLIPVPPLELQEQFAFFVLIHENLKMNRRESTEEIKMLYNSLLSKAFTGELVP